MSNLDMFGFEQFNNPEASDRRFLAEMIALAGGHFICFIIFQAFKYKYFAWGLLIPVVFSFWGIMQVAPRYLDKTNYYETFDSAKWQISKRQNVKMARQMVQSGELTGFNSEQLQAKLGIPDDTLVVDTDHNRLRYYFGVLEVSMEKGKVVQARLSTRGW